ncbi:hypothetical protein D3C71_1529350 [compost metagenome]
MAISNHVDQCVTLCRVARRVDRGVFFAACEAHRQLGTVDPDVVVVCPEEHEADECFHDAVAVTVAALEGQLPVVAQLQDALFINDVVEVIRPASWVRHTHRDTPTTPVREQVVTRVDANLWHRFFQVGPV